MSRLIVPTLNKARTTTDRLTREFEQRIVASPPGVCPVDMQLSFLKVCHAQTCGKCVPCRVGLGQLENIMEDILNNKGTMKSLKLLEETAKKHNIILEQYQSNHEGDLVDKIQAAYGNFDGIVINPAAYTHTSIAILDALKAAGIPAVEVHISDVSKRESFRQISYAGMACEKTIMGKGLDGYILAIEYLLDTYAK